MKHTKYSSIENHYQQEFISKYKELIKPSDLFTVLEKIDGSNLSINYDVENKELKLASRTQFVNNEFNNCWDVLEKKNNLDKYKKLIKYILNKYSPKEKITIFGEIFGGYWFNNYCYKPVLKRVKYSPNKEFLPFDIRIDDIYYLPWNEVRTLFVGTFDECLKFNVHTRSYIPFILGLEENKDEDNYMEGVVIKPLDKEYTTKLGKRVIVKKKSEKFKEKTKSKSKPKSHKSIDKIKPYITESRYYSVISKLPYSINESNIGDIIKEYTNDVLKDAFNDLEINAEEFNDKLLFKNISNLAASNIIVPMIKHNV